MKNVQNLALLGSLLPAANALVGISWSMPKGGLTDITFPISMEGAPQKDGYYFAQQYSFDKSDVNKNIGYTGLQPEASGQVHAVFSTFVAGATSTDANCHDGADSGAGVSCKTDFDGDYNDTFNMVVKNTVGRTWTGTAVSVNTGKSFHIGTYTLPAGLTAILPSQIGFVEYYPWNSQATHSCAQLPNTQGWFGNPTSVSGGGTGKVDEPYEYGDCVGKVAFKDSQSTNGWYVDVGFVGGNGS